MSKTKTSGLGKGLAALMPHDFDQRLLIDKNETVYSLNISTVIPNPDQPRQHFDAEALEGLSQSIKQHGVLQPIVVTEGGDGTYIIIAGERRWRASKLAGLQKIPALVRSAEELEQLELALIENVQRVDLSPLEQARSIERLHQQFNVTYEAIAERLGKAPSTVNNIVRLLGLPVAAREALAAGAISEGHARAILALKHDPKQQELLLAEILKNHWSVREAERFVSAIKKGDHRTKTVRARVATETPDTKRLSKKLGTPVKITRTAKGGKLEIMFHDDTQLDAIMKAL